MSKARSTLIGVLSLINMLMYFIIALIFANGRLFGEAVIIAKGDAYTGFVFGFMGVVTALLISVVAVPIRKKSRDRVCITKGN